MVLISDVIREYSLQEPKDLRIRRRYSPFPDVPFREAVAQKIESAFAALESIQREIGIGMTANNASHCDSSLGDIPSASKGAYDAIITSPPYATALPYIDTQRLSLIWLDLLEPNQLMPVETSLIGSRELGRAKRDTQMLDLMNNQRTIPIRLHNLCVNMHESLDASDGFRRQATPLLLYRYYARMRDMFANVFKVAKKGAPFALVVGSNRASVGGKEYRLDTPQHLAMLGESAGWRIREVMDLQAYHRYGLHAKNSVKTEALVILEK